MYVCMYVWTNLDMWPVDKFVYVARGKTWICGLWTNLGT